MVHRRVLEAVDDNFMMNVTMSESNISNMTVPPDFDLFQICELAKGFNDTYLNFTMYLGEQFYNRSLWKLLDGVEPNAMAVFYAIFFIIAFIWNLVILLIMLVRRKAFKEAAHVFLANLVLTDLFVAVFIILFALISSIPGEWVLGVNDVSRCYTCEISGFFVTFLVDLSIHTLAILSLDRTLHLAFPLRYRTVMTRVKAVVIVVVVWVVVLVLNILPFFGVGIIEFNRRLGLCLVRWSQSTTRSFIYVGVLLAELLIPITVLILANTITFRIISRVLRRSHKKKKDLRRMSTRRQQNIQEQLSREQAQSEEDKHYNKQQRQLVRHFTASFVTSILCWMCLFIMYIVLIIAPDDKIPPFLFTIGFYLYLLTAIIHPMLETYFIPELRLFFTHIKKGVRKELVKQTSSIAEKRRKPSTTHGITDGARTESLFSDSTYPSKLGEENPVFGRSPQNSPHAQTSFMSKDPSVSNVNGYAQNNHTEENQRESTSNESGVFSEVQD